MAVDAHHDEIGAVVSGARQDHLADIGLRRLRETGKLTCGLRTVVALHVIFHWNRIGLPATTQATLAQAAREAIFGDALDRPWYYALRL